MEILYSLAAKFVGRFKSSVIVNIPQEVIMMIMYRLPAKSVGRFRSVSKEWLSLLTDPAFIKTHQNTLNRNHFIGVFKSFDSLGPLYFLPFHQNHIQEATLPKEYALPFDFDVVLDVIGCCNGLVLLSGFSYCKHCRLNVSTTKDFLELPSPNCCFDDPKGDQIRHFKEYYSFLYGFSYDSFTDDYKVVTIFFNKRFLPIVHVYSLRSNTWKHVIEFPYKPFHKEIMSSSSAFTNGNMIRNDKLFLFIFD